MVTREELLEKTRQELKSLIATLILQEPFFGILAKRTWIYADFDTETAYTDGLDIYINPRYFLSLTSDERRMILLHELMHIVLKHSLRKEEFLKKFGRVLDPRTMNILADAKVNQYLEKYKDKLRPQNRGVWPEDVEKGFGLKNVREKSLEELMEELSRKIIEIPVVIVIGGEGGDVLPIPPWIKLKPIDIKVENDKKRPGEPKPTPPVDIEIEIPEDLKIPEDVFDNGKGSGKTDKKKKEKKDEDGEESSDKEKDEKTGKTGKSKEKGKKDEKEGADKSNEKDDKEGKNVLNEGDREDKETDDLEKRWAKKMLEILISEKTIGRDPGHLQRLIEELLKPIVDWRRILRTALTKGIGRNVKRTWARPSRKISDLYPGKETLKLNKVVVLIDTSGSIGENELKRFVSEVYGILRETSKVVVIPWDATVYDPIELRGMNDIQKLKTSIKGGGGTMIYPALKLVDQKFSDYDMFIIFSDWYIGDISTDEVQNILRKYAKKIIAFTTSARPPEFLESHKIQIVE
jgi:predicted metal-dependent peptidase